MDREENLRQVAARSEPWDIIVIGGGATGVGCAIDAAARGLDVLLLEGHDFGKGTSSRSTKLIHGGVRYLAQGNFKLVREALKERLLIMKNASHVVWRQKFVIPCRTRAQLLYYSAGLWGYDRLAGKSNIGNARILSIEETLHLLPGLQTTSLSGGILYYDGQFDDTRLLIDIARTASSYGAAILNYANVVGLQHDYSGSIGGVRFNDVVTGEEHCILARAIINATGAFCHPVRQMDDADAPEIVEFSRGIHIVLDGKFLDGDTALMIPKTTDGRILFAIPWLEHVLVGTTDVPSVRADLEPIASAGEIDFVLDAVGDYLSSKPQHADILSVFAGVRPLVKPRKLKDTATIARDYLIETNESIMLTITGGKWTTYRRMAEDAVDQAMKIANIPSRPSVTADLRILPPSILSPISECILHPDFPYTNADVMRAVRDEMAVSVEDVLARRTRMLFLNAKAAIDIAPAVAHIMATEIGKDKSWIDEQVADFCSVAKNYTVRSITTPPFSR